MCANYAIRYSTRKHAARYASDDGWYAHATWIFLKTTTSTLVKLSQRVTIFVHISLRIASIASI